MTYPANIRAAMREAALGLMEWQDPPHLGDCAWCGTFGVDLDCTGADGQSVCDPCRDGFVYRPWDPQGEVEPFDIDKDWEERA